MGLEVENEIGKTPLTNRVAKAESGKRFFIGGSYRDHDFESVSLSGVHTGIMIHKLVSVPSSRVHYLVSRDNNKAKQGSHQYRLYQGQQLIFF
jgi:hypothetical protein